MKIEQLSIYNKNLDVVKNKDVAVLLHNDNNGMVQTSFISIHVYEMLRHLHNDDHVASVINGSFKEMTGKGNMLQTLKFVAETCTSYSKLNPDVELFCFKGSCPKRARIYEWFVSKSDFAKHVVIDLESNYVFCYV